MAKSRFKYKTTGLCAKNMNTTINLTMQYGQFYYLFLIDVYMKFAYRNTLANEDILDLNCIGTSWRCGQTPYRKVAKKWW